MEELETFTRELVEIPSHADETRAGDWIESWLREYTDATIRRDDHGNVIAYRGRGETTLALVGHHDVVPPDDSQIEGEEYMVETRDGRIYGRGTADMKGAVVAAMCAFRDVDLETQRHATEVEGPTVDELCFVSFVGEETGGRGARGAIDDGFVPEYAVVGEGSTGYSGGDVVDVAVAHKGRRGTTVTTSGTAAHASRPEAGENAIYRGTDAIDAIREFSFPETTVLGHDVRGSIAVTEIEGGSAWNVIPDSCSITVDERTVPGERAPLETLEKLPGVSIHFDQDLPPMACRDSGFADLVLDVARDVHVDHLCTDRGKKGDLGDGVQDEGAPVEGESGESEPIDSELGNGQSNTGEPEHVIKPHATDAGWLSQAGTTCLVCGPAEAGEAHTKTESVSLDVLERCYRIYRRTAGRMME